MLSVAMSVTRNANAIQTAPERVSDGTNRLVRGSACEVKSYNQQRQQYDC